MNFDIYGFTDKGGRDYNEDNIGSAYDKTGGIFVVADGLGGHKFGEKASDIAVKTIIEKWNFLSDDNELQLKNIIKEANDNILSLQKEEKAVMKTTVAVLSVNNEKAYIANTGDSRVYYIHNDELYYVTSDHSVAFKKYRSFEILRNEIGSDEDQSRLLRTLGSEDRYESEIYSSNINIVSGDAFYLCTDGAWEYLKDEEIVIDYLKSENACQWAEFTLLRIMKRVSQKNDNLSVMTVIIE